jgi:hypothetical protein
MSEPKRSLCIDIRKTVFNIYENEQELVDHIRSIEDYATESAKTLVTFLKKNVKKIALTHTSQSFVGSYRCVKPRGGFMSALKGKGTLKNLMTKWSLFDLLSRHDILVKEYEQRVDDVLKKMVRDNVKFTPPVLDAIKKSYDACIPVQAC